MSHGLDTDELMCYIEESYDSNLLDISGLIITSLPLLPEGLEELWCNDTQITELPPLPNGLQVLLCSNTHLKSLPSLPDELQEIKCFNTPLTSLPPLPKWLHTLNCTSTQLTSLPPLPDSLKELYCADTQLPQRNNNENMKDYILRFRSWQELEASRNRVQERARNIKEELVAAVWHPKRVQRIIDLCGEDYDFEML
jgi:hypothetical protein